MIIRKGHAIRREPDGSVVYGPDHQILCNHMIQCDDCYKPIAWVHECDLNGTYFQCFDCKKTELLEAK